MLRQLALAGVALFGCLCALPVAILGLIVVSAAVMAADIATVCDKAVVLPFGDWIVAIVQTDFVAAPPVLVALIIPWLSTFVP